jgi:hypothetical protein
MLVIVADAEDPDAAELVELWRHHDAQLLSIADLSVAGWCHRVASPGAGTAVVAGRVTPVGQITGVLTLLPCVFAERLLHIVPEDRAYVAAEMTAFLASWLSDLTCPVLNPPTPGWLTGPNWRPAQWIHAAASLGVPVHPARYGTAGDTASAKASVTVVADQCFGDVDGLLATSARRLASLAGVEMLTVHFDGSSADARMVGAEIRPDLRLLAISEAVLRHLTGTGGC